MAGPIRAPRRVWVRTQGSNGDPLGEDLVQLAPVVVERLTVQVVLGPDLLTEVPDAVPKLRPLAVTHHLNVHPPQYSAPPPPLPQANAPPFGARVPQAPSTGGCGPQPPNGLVSLRFGQCSSFVLGLLASLR